MKKPLVIVSKSSPIEARPFGLPIEALPQLKEFAKQLDALKVHRDRMWAAAESLFPQDDDGKPPIITEAKLESAKCILSQYRQSLLRNTLVNGDIERAEAELLAMVPEASGGMSNAALAMSYFPTKSECRRLRERSNTCSASFWSNLPIPKVSFRR